MHRDALLERSLLEQVEIDRHVVVVEQRPAEAEDRGMGEQQQLVEKPRPEQLGRECRAAHPDAAIGAGPQSGELLDGVVAADDPGVVIGAAAGAGDEHLGGSGPDLSVLTQDLRQRRVVAGPGPVLLHDLVDDPALDHERERPRLRVELTVQLLVDTQPLAGTVVPWDLLDPQVQGHVHPVDEATHELSSIVLATRNHYIEAEAPVKEETWNNGPGARSTLRSKCSGIAGRCSCCATSSSTTAATSAACSPDRSRASLRTSSPTASCGSSTQGS